MKNVAVGLFPQERVFLNKACENLTHDFKLKNVLISIFAIDNTGGNLRSEKLFCKAITDNPDGVDMEEYLKIAESIATTLCMDNPGGRIEAKVASDIAFAIKTSSHVVSILDVMGTKKAIVVDICMYGRVSKLGFMNLGTGLTEIMGRMRGGVYVSTAFSLGDGVMQELPITTEMVMKAVDQWLANDEDYQFWDEISRPYLRGYFHEPDLTGMGRNMMRGINKALQEIVRAKDEIGSLLIEIDLFEGTMKEAFGFEAESVWSQVKTIIPLGSKEDVLLTMGERTKFQFNFRCIDNDDQMEPLLDVCVKTETMRQIDAGVYKAAIMKEIMKCVEVWREINGRTGYDCKFSEERTEF